MREEFNLRSIGKTLGKTTPLSTSRTPHPLTFTPYPTLTLTLFDFYPNFTLTLNFTSFSILKSCLRTDTFTFVLDTKNECADVLRLLDDLHEVETVGAETTLGEEYNVNKTVPFLSHFF